MGNYTKGDWRVDQVAGGYNIWLHLCPEKDPAKWDRIARVGGELSKTKEIREQAKANAERIVQCVNNFDDLLEACKEARKEIYQHLSDRFFTIPEEWKPNYLDSAIQKAEKRGE